MKDNITVWYRFTIPHIERKGNTILSRQFLLRVYGRHTIVITENGMTTSIKCVFKKPIEMTMPFIMHLLSKYFYIPYIHHYTKVCRMEVITK